MHLRPLEPEDLELLYTIENDERLWNTSNTDGPYSRFALKNYIASSDNIYECGQLRLVIDIANIPQSDSTISPNAHTSSQPIGLIDLTNYSSLNARAEVGITLLRAYQGQGYGQRALQLMEHYATERLRIHSLYAYVSPHNLPSFHLFQNNGYKVVAKLPDWSFREGKYEEIALFLKIF